MPTYLVHDAARPLRLFRFLNWPPRTSGLRVDSLGAISAASIAVFCDFCLSLPPSETYGKAQWLHVADLLQFAKAAMSKAQHQANTTFFKEGYPRPRYVA